MTPTLTPDPNSNLNPIPIPHLYCAFRRSAAKQRRRYIKPSISTNNASVVDANIQNRITITFSVPPFAFYFTNLCQHDTQAKQASDWSDATTRR